MFQLGHVFSDMEMEVVWARLAWFIFMFQLGDVFSDMEIWPSYRQGGSSLPVSIGPRPFRHGNITAFGIGFSYFLVSIGPRPFRHGNTGKVSRELEILYKVSIGPRLFRHGNSKKISTSMKILCCFNWATSFQTWKWWRVVWAWRTRSSRFNWATSFQTWK